MGMKIIVFGATGGVGQFVVSQGLEAGFEITAFVRTPTKLIISHENLKIVQGNAFNQEEVSAAIKGHNAVVSCLGSSQGMKNNHVDRIIYTASAGIDKEIPGLSGKLVMQMLKNALVDHRAAVDYIQSNGLNYTIVRPMGLTNHPFTGKYRESATSVPEKSRSISRADVAHFIIKALKDTNYNYKSIGIAN